ncbi:UNKNOWN [Stylonychia lemnae]|uniref:Uncharacterized protein n=1 Tax=Stylonychia lemnae TaxID=5949 RepID=A0A078B9M6_STYLE|nr:UNKNOWN [Stylonychia lemnae]|eukprot:CDW89957.1 UNKNOWN [Stylonychia lemnae]
MEDKENFDESTQQEQTNQLKKSSSQSQSISSYGLSEEDKENISISENSNQTDHFATVEIANDKQKEQIVQNRKGEKLEIFLDDKNDKVRNSQEYLEFNDFLLECDNYKKLVIRLRGIIIICQFGLEKKENYYFLYLSKPRDWWKFPTKLIDDDNENLIVSIEIINSMLKYVKKSINFQKLRGPRMKFAFNKMEISSLLNDQEIIKALQWVSQRVKFNDDSFKDYLECLKLIAKIADSFNHKMKTLISYRLQMKSQAIFSHTFWNIQQLINENEDAVDHNQFTAILDMYRAYELQNHQWEYIWDFYDMIIKMVTHLKKQIDVSNDVYSLPQGLQLKDIFVYIQILKDLIRDIKLRPDTLQLQDLVEMDIAGFMLSIYELLDKNYPQKSRLHHYVEQYIYQNILEIADSCILNQELVQMLVESNNSQFLILLKQSLFDENSPLFHSYFIKRKSLKIYLELSKIAVINTEIFECFQREGFIDLSSINFQDIYYLNTNYILRESLKNLRKAESVNKILNQQVYAACS